MRAVTLLFVAAHVGVAAGGLAGQSPTPPAALVPGARVRVSAPGLRQSAVVGELVRVERDSIWVRIAHQDSAPTPGERRVSVLTAAGGSRAVLWGAPVGALTRVEVSRGRRSRAAGMARGAGKGFLYLGGAGAVLGLFIRDPNEFLYEDQIGGAVFWGIFFGTLGGTAGALYGLAAPGERWQQLPLPLNVQ